MAVDLLELAKAYEAERDKLHILEGRVVALKRRLDEAREWDEKRIWCHTCQRRHYTWSRLRWGRHQTVRIPKRCLTKYDHVYKYAGFREEPPDPEAEAALGNRALAQRPDHGLTKEIAISECIVCGEKKEDVYGWR